MPTKEELEAELDRRRREARQRIERSRRIGRFIGLLVILAMGVAGALSFGYLLRSVGWQKTTIIAVVILVLVALEVAALKINALRGNPLPQQAIIIAFLVAMATFLTLVV